jgi:pimeloyl-ACP methyl ester carboxylesterase
MSGPADQPTRGDDAATDTTAVVFVHGLWMTGLESFALRHHVLNHQGWQWRTFHYHSVAHRQADAAAALDETIRSLDVGRLHLVGHSLGGLVIHRAMEHEAGWPPGRVLFLGTPSLGSRAAGHFNALPLGDWLLGHAAEALLDTASRRWESPRELGIIAGTDTLSLGSLVTRFAADEPNDGMVSVAETRLPGATAHLVLPVSHTGMLFDSRVARQVCTFLDTGRFEDTQQRT